MMKLKYVWVALLSAPLFLAACSKQEKTATPEQSSASEVVIEASATSSEQQSVIDALDKPIQDEHNTDIPESVSNAPADEATAE